MPRYSGEATFRVPFTVKINLTEEQWDSLSYREQKRLLDEHITDFSCAELDDFDVDGIIED